MYADSMMQTPIGDSLYDYYMTLEYDFTDSLEVMEAAYNLTMSYFMGIWNATHFPWECDPVLATEDTTCHNYHWELSEQPDTLLEGWDLFFQIRYGIDTCNTSAINWRPMPAASRPTVAENSDPGFRFNLNPNDNGDLSLLNSTVWFWANFQSFELYEDEDDVIIPHLISSTPPSGNRAMRINDDHHRFHINMMRRNFEVEAENPTYYFSYAFVMEDPNHGPGLNPFFKAVVYDDSCNVIDEICIIANVNNSEVDVIHINGYSPIVYKQWTCDSFNLQKYIGETVTIEFTAADCGAGYHFGYAYVADICDDCSASPHISFYDAGDYCGIPDLCGRLTFGAEDFEFVDLELQVTHSGEILLTGGDYTYDPETGEFCFDVDESFFSTLDDDCYDIYAVAYLINQYGDTVSVRTLSIKENTVESYDNDLCIPIEECCPDTLNFIWLADLDNIECIDAGSSGEKIISMEFVLYLPEGYVDCDYEPVFENGYFDYDDYTYSSTTNSIHVKGEYHITDISGFDEDYVIRGTIDLCNEEDSTVCPATFEIAKIDCHSNCSEDPCAEGVECNASLDVTYVHGGWTYLTFCVYLLEPLGECGYGDYDIYIYDEWGIVLSHSVNPGRVGTNGFYCVEFEYETELEELCFDILIYNDCTELVYCESTICVDNEAFWGGGNIESRSATSVNSGFKIIPNPVSVDQIAIVSDRLSATNAQVSIYGIYGQTLQSDSDVDLIQGQGRLDITDLHEGYYFLKVTLPEQPDFVQYIPFVVIK
jgi:hypothetical protein